MNKAELYHEIYEQKEKLGNLISDYWNLYSGMDTWYFWFNVASVLIPLVILYFAIDRQRIFEISFFGFAVHVLWANVDSVLSSNNYLVHAHTLTHLLPVGINMTAVLLPVAFMLLYQFCTNRNKNFYIYTIILSVIFAYIFGSFSLATELLKMAKGMNLTYLFLIDLAVVFPALWLTKLFHKIKNSGKEK